MNATVSLTETLLEEFYTVVRTTSQLLKKADPSVYDFRPAENMRTFLELANHLVQISHVDLAILQEKSEKEIRELEKKLSAQNVAELTHVLEEGYHLLKSYFLSLSEEEFLNKETKAFYAEKGMTQAKWLVEIVTHAFHHRAQLFTYLKQTKHEVNMFDLY
ncbi:DinB family protein [Fictibacillus phosphorivorans]|uniref:DinB family protein n=1 Tax=Fictibacillus phosphorivorans TaxID=1221500 RepID=UPI00203C4288|nr:DinB family protein [Fictibacillus phosphorivorans]MCM3719396.1 DinB family protein [Fictibacillus phosphorivorans]MCM3777126.1 DinB family protein [Fictibacillus phosphorivorans]